MLLPSSLRSVERTSTRSLENGRQRLMILMLRLMPAKRNAATTTVSSTGSRLLMMKLLSNLMLSRGRIRTLLMRSRTSLINWEMVVAPSTSWTNNVADWKLRRKSSRLLLNKKKTRFSGLSLNLDKFAKRLIVASKRRRKSLTIPGRTTNVLWNLWVLPLRVNNVQRVKPFASRRNWNLTSMSLRLPLIMPTRLMLRDKRPSRATKDNLGTLFKAMRNKLVDVKKSWRLLVLLSAKLVLSVERLRSL